MAFRSNVYIAAGRIPLPFWTATAEAEVTQKDGKQKHQNIHAAAARGELARRQSTLTNLEITDRDWHLPGRNAVLPQKGNSICMFHKH